jgi:heat shock protein HtpX
MMRDTSPYNSRRAWVILTLPILFSATLGFLIGKSYDAGFFGAGIAILIASCYSLFAYFFAESLIIYSLKAKRILQENNVHLYQRVREIADKAQIPSPELYYIDDSAINILSLGRQKSKGKIIITKGLIDSLATPEVEAVISHEIMHIKSLDTLPGSYATVIVGIFPFFAELLKRKSIIFLPLSLVLSLFSPLSALLIHSVISPKREFEADAGGVLLTRYPAGLSQALEKIAQDPYAVTTALQATAHLFIVNPFHGKANRSASILFNTHPPLHERLKILQEM